MINKYINKFNRREKMDPFSIVFFILSSLLFMHQAHFTSMISLVSGKPRVLKKSYLLFSLALGVGPTLVDLPS